MLGQTASGQPGAHFAPGSTSGQRMQAVVKAVTPVARSVGVRSLSAAASQSKAIRYHRYGDMTKVCA
jgi:hypothetical protein